MLWFMVPEGLVFTKRRYGRTARFMAMEECKSATEILYRKPGSREPGINQGPGYNNLQWPTPSDQFFLLGPTASPNSTSSYKNKIK